LYYFASECGDESDSQSGMMKFVRGTISRTISDNRAYFEKFAVDDPRNKTLIDSLMAIIDETT